VALLYVTSSNPGEGKTGVAAAIARHLAYAGTPVRLVRLAEGEATNSEADARWFATLAFAPGSPAEPQPAIPAEAHGETLVVEGPAAAAPTGAKVVSVARGKKPAAPPAGTVAVVVTGAAGIALSRATAGSPVVVEVGEDRTLAGFSMSEARAALNAEVLVPAEQEDVTSDRLVIAPISSDAGQPYFRRFDSKAVVVRFDKTDQHLAAIKGQPNLLILTGGRRPSEYLFDAAAASGVPVLLSRTDTENTVIALEGIFDRTRFCGERKLERMSELLAGTGLFEALA
jgi:BioD-like phosphotransacetylase family protein